MQKQILSAKLLKNNIFSDNVNLHSQEISVKPKYKVVSIPTLDWREF
jgi:hypothetical protein